MAGDGHPSKLADLLRAVAALLDADPNATGAGAASGALASLTRPEPKGDLLTKTYAVGAPGPPWTSKLLEKLPARVFANPGKTYFVWYSYSWLPWTDAPIEPIEWLWILQVARLGDNLPRLPWHCNKQIADLSASDGPLYVASGLATDEKTPSLVLNPQAQGYELVRHFPGEEEIWTVGDKVTPPDLGGALGLSWWKFSAETVAAYVKPGCAFPPPGGILYPAAEPYCDPNDYHFFFVPESNFHGKLLMAVEIGWQLPAVASQPVLDSVPFDVGKIKALPGKDACANVGGVWPYGWVASPDHVLPTPVHAIRIADEFLGSSPEGSASEFPIYAPSSGVLFQVQCRWLKASKGSNGMYFDYQLHLALTTTYGFVINHLRSLNAAVVPQPYIDMVNAAAQQELANGNPFGVARPLNISVASGSVLGYAGGGNDNGEGPPPGVSPLEYDQLGIDVSGFNYLKPLPFLGETAEVHRYSDEALNADSPFRYLTPGPKSAVHQLLLGKGGRIGDPWGSSCHDVAGRLLGNWFRILPVKPTASVSDKESHLSFAYDYFYHGQLNISMGDPNLWLPGSTEFNPSGESPIPHPPGTVHRVLDLTEARRPENVGPTQCSAISPMAYKIMAGRCPLDSAAVGVFLVGFLNTGGTKIRVQVIPVPAWTEIPGALQFTDAAVDYER